MRIPTRERTRRAGLALAAALLFTLPVLAAPPSPHPAAEAGVEAAAAGWIDGFADLWHKLLAAAGVPVAGSIEPIEPQLGDDDTTQLKAYGEKGENGASLDPNGRA